MKRKFLAWLLTFAMVFNIAMPYTAFAEDMVIDTDGSYSVGETDTNNDNDATDEVADDTSTADVPTTADEQDPVVDEPAADGDNDAESDGKEVNQLAAAVPMMATLGADEPMPVADTDGETASPVTVYVSVTLSGELQKAKDGTYMAYREVNAEDADKDGKITLHDVMYSTHKQYYMTNEGSLGYALAEGDAKGVSTFWGQSKSSDTFSNLFFHIISYNQKCYKGGETGTDESINMEETAVTEGQYISVSSMGETAYGAEMFASLDTSSSKIYFVPDVSVQVNKEFQLTLCSVSGTGFPGALVDYTIYVIDEDGKTISPLKNANNENVTTKKQSAVSVFTAAFSKPGTYTLVTQPKDHNHGYGAAVVRVHVYEGIALDVSDIKVGLDDSLAESLISFDANTKEYDITIPEGTKNLYGSVNYSTSENLKTELCGTFEIYKSNAWKTKSGDSGTVITSQAVNDKVWNARITVGDKYVQNAAFSEYNFNIKRVPYLTGLAITDWAMSSDFVSSQNDYTAFVTDTVTSFGITPTANAEHTIKINGKEVTSGEKSTIDVSSLTFNEAGETELTISVSDKDERYIENTYKFTIIKAPANNIPSILLQPKDGYYLVNGAADDLSVMASAGGEVTYQWYSNTTNSTENAQKIEGQTNSKFKPSTDKAGTYYYFCKVTNSTTQDSVYSNIAQIKVYPDPTPKISWKTEIPQIDAETLTYLAEKHPTGKLPNDAKKGDNYYGYYYRADDTDIAKLEVNASSEATDGEFVYSWSYRQPISGGAVTNFHNEASYTPDTSTANGARVYSVKAGYKLLGEPYWSDEIYAYVFTDEAKVTYPTQEGAITWIGDGTKDNPWLLENQTDLEELRGFVNAGYTFANTYLALKNNIDLDTTWKGIGEVDGESLNGVNIEPFSGDFDGKGNILTYAKGSQYPLFNYVREATVHDMIIYAPYIANYCLVANYVVDYGEDGNYNVGTGGSYAPGCPDIIDIVNVTIKSDSIILKAGFIGGGASGGNTVNIIGCTAQNNVKIGCMEDGTSAEQPLIATFADTINGSVTQCISYADVYGSNSVAGIVVGKGQAMGKFEVNNCAFLGSVNASGKYAGGIAAQGYSADSAPNAPCVSIVNCYVAGDITGKDYVGGIFGGEPGVVQTWQNGVGNIKNNFFYGKATAINGKYVGGIIGSMKSLNMYNCIENNYYLNTGAQKAIGGVEYIDTSTHEFGLGKDGVFYFDTSRDSIDDIKAVVDAEDYGTANWQYTSVTKTNHNRTDDPMGTDADNLGKAMTATEFADGTVLRFLNQHSASFKNWAQDTKYPTISAEPVAYQLEISGDYKTEYYIGEKLDMTGATFTATWTDGSTTNPTIDDVKITDFDSTARKVLTLTASYGSASTTFQVSVLKADGGSTGGSATPSTIKVKFTLLGDTHHDEYDNDNPTVHALKKGNLETWIAEEEYTIGLNDTVWELLKKVQSKYGSKGLNFYNPKGNYVSKVTFDGLTMEEKENTANSGWMYTLNGHHSLLAVNEQFLENGDIIVFHWTDDYTIEEGSDEFDNSGNHLGGGSSATTKEDEKTEQKPAVSTTVTPEVKADKNGEAKADIKADTIKDAISDAKNDKADEIVIAPKVDGEANKVTVTIPASSANAVAKDANADLKVKTDIADIKISSDDLSKLGSTGNLTVSAEKKSDGTVEVKVTANGKNVQLSKGSVTVEKKSAGANDVLVIVKADGTEEVIKKSVTDKDGITAVIDGSCTVKVVSKEVDFNDTAKHWANEAAQFVAAREIFNGTGAKTFAPNDKMDRQMVATVLWRLENEVKGTSANKFNDEVAGWAKDAVVWAAGKQIVNGDENGNFNGNQSVSRQELAAMLYRYAKSVGMDTTASGSLSKFADNAQVADWATDAMKWAVGSGLMKGNEDGTINPNGTATRGEVATVVMRLVEKSVR